ncbi:MAG: iron-containing alcohol dehydrogenase [Clostridia bacterium]|nr:iron-containing alcohol dehydrogenase [Clostridia bacterium]
MIRELNFADRSFRSGCGRYIQEDGAIGLAGTEALRLVTRRLNIEDAPMCPPEKSRLFVMGGETALSKTRPALDTAFEECGFKPVFHVYRGFCNPNTCDTILKSGALDGASLVVGVGGGNIMDAAKYVAMTAELPLLNIPTTAATCAACTPLSVLYNDNCGYIKSKHWPFEISGVIVDTAVMAGQPERMLVSGVLDAVAKLPETTHRLTGKSEDETDIGSFSSSVLSTYTYRRLFELLPEAAAELKTGKCGKALYDIVYLTVGLTGTISGLSRGQNQSALAHKIYESSRTLFPREVSGFLHGEIVAIGVILQKYFNSRGDTADALEFKAVLDKYHMPSSLRDLGIPMTDEAMEAYCGIILPSSAMAGAGDAEKQLFRDALRFVF